MAGFEKEYTITAEEGGKRLDSYISAVTDISRSHAERLISEGHVLVNGVLKEKKYKISAGDVLDIKVPAEKIPDLTPREMDISVIYECGEYAVIDKPAGITVHPAAGTGDDTIVNGLLHRFDIRDDNDVRPGIVHRLDKDTSGILLVAKNRTAREKLSGLFAGREVNKSYLAVCWGNPKFDHIVVEAPVGRHIKDRKKMSVTENGRYAKSEITVLKRLKGAFLAEVKIYTGRTHQIRVHMSHLGFPVAGDKVYGNKNSLSLKIDRQALHSHRLGFTDPFSGEKMEFVSPMPDDMEMLIKRLVL